MTQKSNNLADHKYFRSKVEHLSQALNTAVTISNIDKTARMSNNYQQARNPEQN